MDICLSSFPHKEMLNYIGFNLAYIIGIGVGLTRFKGVTCIISRELMLIIFDPGGTQL